VGGDRRLPQAHRRALSVAADWSLGPDRSGCERPS
jgi:hypothetical protein